MIFRPRSLIGRILVVVLVLFVIISVVKRNSFLRNTFINDGVMVTRILYRETSSLVRFINKRDTVSQTVMVAKRLRNKINGVLSNVNTNDIRRIRYKITKR